MAKGKARATEVDAYIFIKQDLKALGWNVRNPARPGGGQVYTQNECLSHEEIQEQWGARRPENVVKLSESSYWVIEAKRDRNQLDQALKEAQDYANDLNRSAVIKAVLITGIAGNDADKYIVRSAFLQGDHFRPVTLNEQPASALLSPQIVRMLLESGTADIADVPIDEAVFLASAEKINGYLHDGSINKNVRARNMAALLLSLVGDTLPNVDAEPLVLINDINTRADSVLKDNGKGAFFEYVRITPPTSPDNHAAYKTALVKTLHELTKLNIRSAMNSGTDVLGKFYEVFLKYGNGAKEIGIVLTPRHVTRFAAAILDVRRQDIVLDPTCGTGGFLVAAFDQVRRASTKSQIDQFKENNLFGIDVDPEVAALAIVNMIFRGDGKNNIIEGNIFQKHLVPTTVGSITSAVYTNDDYNGAHPVTKVMMNPPFALKSSDQKEYRFVQRGLDELAEGELLFSVLPVSALFESGEEREWRRNRLLGENTLICVITFPHELFYPIGVHTVGIVVRKGVPHPLGQPVLWVRAFRDGYVKRKGKRLQSTSEPDDLSVFAPIIRAFITTPGLPITTEPERIKIAPIDMSDPLLELVPEAYLDARSLTPQEIQRAAEQLVRETAALAIRFPELWSRHEES